MIQTGWLYLQSAWQAACSWLVALWKAFSNDKLAVALLQLLVGALLAYYFTERWQRWRQRREFQHKILVKFSELSHEVLERLINTWDLAREQNAQADLDAAHRAAWTKAFSLMGLDMELSAVFVDAKIPPSYLRLVGTLRDLQTLDPMTPEGATRANTLQNQYLAYRELVSALMIREIGTQKAPRIVKRLQRAEEGVAQYEAPALTRTTGVQ